MPTTYDWITRPKYELFDDLNALNEITDPQQVVDLLGDPVVLERYRTDTRFDYLMNRTVGIAELCWNNRTPDGEKLQKTNIRHMDLPVTLTFKDGSDQAVVPVAGDAYQFTLLFDTDDVELSGQTLPWEDEQFVALPVTIGT